MKNIFRSMLEHILKSANGTKRASEEIPGINGIVEVTVKDSNGLIVYYDKQKNVVLDVGKTEIMDILRNNIARETAGTVRSLCRFAVGDGGADPSSLQTPKSLDKSRTGLFNEVHRKDITSSIKSSGNAIEFTVDINSNSLSASDFNGANAGEYLNEATIIASMPGTYAAGHHLTGGVVGPDDVLITHKTLKSFPFTPGLNINATFKWTLFVSL